MHHPTNGLQNTTNSQGSGPSALAKAASAISVSGVSREFQNFLSDIEDLIKETTSLTGEELAHARARLNARVANAKAFVEGIGDNIVQRAKQSATVTNEYVHEQPWKALGASTAIAFLLGIAIARRSPS